MLSGATSKIINRKNNMPRATADLCHSNTSRAQSVIVIMALMCLMVVPAIAATERIYVHTAIQGDSFARLAQRHFVNKNNWQVLEKHNPGVNPTAIPLGKKILMPVSAMRADLASPTVVSVRGVASVNGGKLAEGQRLNERDTLSTGGDGFVTIKLADGSTLTVQSKSAVEIERARLLGNTKVGESVVRLASGRLETSVAKQNAAARYEVRTPTSNMGVRGTIFRAGSDPVSKKSLSEVVEGAVGVSEPSVAPTAGVGINAGFGTFIESGKPPSPPIQLLPAPVVPEMPDTKLRADVDIAFAPVVGATGYRTQVATDEKFLSPVAEVVSQLPLAKLTGLPDGGLFVRVRAIDAVGLEGITAERQFRIAARPFSPAMLTPINAGRVTQSRVTLSWKAADVLSNAQSVRVQIARDAQFTNIVDEHKNVNASSLTTSRALADGRYFWRLGSTVAGQDGPYGDARQFEVRATRPDITPIGNVSDANLSWQGEAGQHFQYQVSRREAFTDVLVDKIITDPRVKLEGLPKSVYFIRVRTVASGSTATLPREAGDWSATYAIEIFGRLF